MANVTVKHMTDLAADVLQDDEDNEHWSLTKLINWYNMAGRKIVQLRPDANAVLEAIKLASGVKQSIPARGMAFVGANRNMGTDGLTLGDAIHMSTLDIINAFDTSWITDTAAATILNAMPDRANPTAFWVYPASDGTPYIEIEFSQAPESVVYDSDGDWESNLVTVGEGFVNAVLNLMLCFAYQKDSDYPGNAQRSAGYYNMAMQDLGLPQGAQQGQEGGTT